MNAITNPSINVNVAQKNDNNILGPIFNIFLKSHWINKNTNINGRKFTVIMFWYVPTSSFCANKPNDPSIAEPKYIKSIGLITSNTFHFNLSTIKKITPTNTTKKLQYTNPVSITLYTPFLFLINLIFMISK